jgi:hypothetical protein
MQPAEFIHMNQIGFLEGNVIKYVCRHAAKNGRDDLLKARHYIDLLLEWQYGGVDAAPVLPMQDEYPVDAGNYHNFLPDHSPKPADHLKWALEKPPHPAMVVGEPLKTCPCGRLICKVCKWP